MNMKTFNKMRNENGEMRNCFFSGAILVLSAFCFLLSSCSQDEVFEQDSLKDTPLTIASAGVTELTTRAITEGQLVGSVDENVSISVWVEGSADKYNANNVEWVHDGTNWYSNSTVLYEGENKQKICALSPYVDGASAEGVTITADGVTDYLVASQTSITSNPVNICMSHALAKLVLNPTLGTEVTGDNIATVEVQNMYTQGTLNVEVNNWTNCTGTTAFTMTNNEVLVVPMEGCESFPIVITMESGRVFSANISLANVDNKLEGGTQYTIKLQIGYDTVTIGDISAASWGTPVDGGDLETE
jgi:hypothetical protein